MKNSPTYGVILAGGIGSRFWPLSRELEPKQFLSLNSNKSLFQQTIERILPIIQPERIYIIGNQQHKLEIEKQISFYSIPKDNVILEPEGKNTAPAIGLAARVISYLEPESTMVVLPADHYISDKEKLLKILKDTIRLAQKDYLVTIGIKPDSPHTGYGYIKAGAFITKHNAYSVEKFVEKPDKKRAEKFFNDKRYYWNSGIFVWKTKVILEEIKAYLPDLLKKLHGIESFTPLETTNDSNINYGNTYRRVNKRKCFRSLTGFTDINKKIWSQIQPVSVDYGILEKSKRVAVVVAKNIGWSDLGSWSALAEVLPKDKNGNVIQADSIDIGSRNIAIFGNSRLIATIGLKNLIISNTQDALLICDRSRAEEVKTIVQILNQNERSEVSVHKTVNRPWGSYTVLNEGERFKVKLVEVLPNKRLSLQRHKFRSEHWVVVDGQAVITNGNRICKIKTNESTFIPKNQLHRLENPTNKPLKIIEVQNGDYLEEDDIERLKDDYGRLEYNIQS